MPRRVHRVACLAALLATLAILPAVTAQEDGDSHVENEGGDEAVAATGRFLYANDDDWDWATPGGAENPCALARDYGEVEWSALDWMEEGLAEVRGILIGTWPSQLTGEALTALRRSEDVPRHYSRIDHRAGTLAASVVRTEANVIILMRDTYREFEVEFSEEDLEALQTFVRGGGRLMVMDDWNMYLPLLDALTDPQVILDRAPKPGEKREPLAQPGGNLAMPNEAFDDLLDRAREVDTRAELLTIQGNSLTAPPGYVRERKVLRMKIEAD